MKLTLEQLRHLANLSRLDLNDEQLSELQDDLAKMMAMADQVQKLDTSQISGVVNVHENDAPMRADEAAKPQQDLSTGAKQNQDGMVVVPSVLNS